MTQSQQTTQDGSNPDWKKIDLSDGDSCIREINPQEKVVFEEGSLPGHKLRLVRVEEVWATDPDTGLISDRLSQQTYIRDCTDEEQASIATRAYADGILASALSAHFR